MVIDSDKEEEYNLHIFLSNYFKDYNDKRTKYFNLRDGRNQRRKHVPHSELDKLAKEDPEFWGLNKTSKIIDSIKNEGKPISGDREYLKKLILFLFHFDANIVETVFFP